MTNHYNIHLPKTKTDLKVTYRDNKFRKLEHLRGKFDQAMLNAIGRIIPVNETKFESFKKEFKSAATYTQQQTKQKTIYSQFLSEWYAFYKQFVGIQPKFTGADGNALKQIINYLKEIGSTEQEALVLWQLILSKWNTLNKFHQENTDLKYINSQLNKILQNVKGTNKSNEQVFTDAAQSEVGKNFKFK